MSPRRFLVPLVLAAAAILVAAPAALAIDGYFDYLPAWTQVASACTVDEASQSLVALNSPYVSFALGKTGSINLRCNVTNPLDDGSPIDWNSLIALYKDPDGTGTSYRVLARLYRVTRTGGNAIVASFDSNIYSATGVREYFKSFTEDLNFLTHYYYVLVTLTRSVTTANPSIYALRLCFLQAMPSSPEQP